jgi:hypothetical protein
MLSSTSDLIGDKKIAKQGTRSRLAHQSRLLKQRTGSSPYSSNRSLVPTGFSGAIEASGICAALPWSRKRLTIG